MRTQQCHVFCVNTHQHVQSGRQNNLHNPSEPWLSVSKRVHAQLRRHTFTNHMEELTRTLLYIYAGKGSTVCSSLHCGTRYLTAVPARPTAQVPSWAGNVSGGRGSIPGQFWRTGVPSFRRCSAEPLHSGSVKYRDVVRPLHRPLHYQVRGWRRLKKIAC